MRVRDVNVVGLYLRSTSALILFVLLCAPASAEPVIFLDRDAFNLAAEPNRSIPFDADVSDCVFDPSSSTCNHTFDGLLSVSYDIAGIGLLGDALGLGFFAGQSSAHSFLEPVTAIGFDLVGIQSPLPQDVIFSFAGLTIQYTSGPLSSPQFFGVIFDTPQTFIPASANGAVNPLPLGFVIENLAVTTVPEPATLVLFGTAVSVVVGSRRFMSRRRSPRL